MALAISGVLVIAGCGTDGGSTEEPSAVETSQATETQEAEATSTEDLAVHDQYDDPGLKACSMVMDGGDESIASRIPKVFAGEDGLTMEDVDEMRLIDAALQEARTVAPVEMAGPLVALQTPYSEIIRAVDAGEVISVDTSTIMADMLDLTTACVDVGFKISN